MEDPELFLAALAALGVSTWFGIKAVRLQLRLNSAQEWSSVLGLIKDAYLFHDEDKDAIHFKIIYTFQIGEELIEGSTPRISGDWFWSEKSQEAFVANYDIGEVVTVYYDPKKPAKRNCIERTNKSGIYTLWGIVAFMGILGIAACIMGYH